MAGKNAGKRAPASSSAYNGWMFARDFSQGIFGLLNTGKIYPAFALLCILIVGIVVWRLPSSALAQDTAEILRQFGGSAGFWGLLFFVSNFGWVTLFRQQRRLYRDEIDRLASLRSELMHGLPNAIKEHRSSLEVAGQTHIFPSPKRPGQ